MKYWLVLCLALFGPATVLGQFDYENAPICYGAAPGNNRIVRLMEQLEDESFQIPWDDHTGFLRGLLQLLDIPQESQTLVFSKTSFQLQKISPSRPRAVYFNEDTYVGWVRDSEIIELASSDPGQGALFYTLERRKDGQARIILDRGQCLICHSSTRTQGVPGFLVRSIYPNGSGHAVSGTSSYSTDDASPFEQRWGGWYVTGHHGSMRHLGNITYQEDGSQSGSKADAGQNLTSLPRIVPVQKYLQPSSDIVALMVLEHQIQMHNWLTRVGFETRIATHQDETINEALGREKSFQTESTRRRIATVVDKLVRYMLMVDAIELSSPVEGTSAFAEEFSKRGRRDPKGRSLHELDLKTRLFKYRCSYLIDSDCFQKLPEPALKVIGARLREILLDDAAGAKEFRLTDTERRELCEILAEVQTPFWMTYVLPRE